MNAQDIVKAAILADPEKVIGLAIQMRPDIRSIVDAARAAPGPLSGVAAVALRHALRGADNAATQANLEAFAAQIA